jgi:hypothetical protein
MLAEASCCCTPTRKTEHVTPSAPILSGSAPKSVASHLRNLPGGRFMMGSIDEFTNPSSTTWSATSGNGATTGSTNPNKPRQCGEVRIYATHLTAIDTAFPGGGALESYYLAQIERVSLSQRDSKS